MTVRSKILKILYGRNHSEVPIYTDIYIYNIYKVKSKCILKNNLNSIDHFNLVSGVLGLTESNLDQGLDQSGKFQ